MSSGFTVSARIHHLSQELYFGLSLIAILSLLPELLCSLTDAESVLPPFLSVP